MNYLIEQFNRSRSDHLQAAELVSEWSKQFETMASYRPEEISSHVIGVLALSESGSLLGYVGVTELDKISKKARVGALAIGQHAQGNGLASEIIGKITDKIEEDLPEVHEVFAYVNEQSKEAFFANRYEVTGQRDPPAPTGCNTIVSIQISR